MKIIIENGKVHSTYDNMVTPTLNEGQSIVTVSDGSWYEIGSEASFSDSDLLIDLRAKRDSLLQKAISYLDRHRNQKEYGLTCCLTDEKVAEWAAYAQALRAIPSTYANNPGDVVWPSEPS